MSNKSMIPQFLPSTIFQLLSICRTSSTIPQKRKSFHRLLANSGCKFDFWRRLCQTLGLLDTTEMLQPSFFVPKWFQNSVANQWADCLQAWCTMVQDPRQIMRRKKILDQLAKPVHCPFNRSELRELEQLRQFGLWDGKALTESGRLVFDPQSLSHGSLEPSPWRLENLTLIVPHPTNLSLLWELERFISPYSPGQYSLAGPGLRQAAQRGEPRRFIQILEQGLQQPLAPAFQSQIEGQPVIRLLSGPLLEFSSPSELQKFRDLNGFKHLLAKVVSPHHVALNPAEEAVCLKYMAKMGIQVKRVSEPTPPETPVLPAVSNPATKKNRALADGVLAAADRAYLYSILALGRSLNIPLSEPDGLCKKLTRGLSASARLAAEKRGLQLAEGFAPPWLPPEEELPPAPLPEKIKAIELAIARQDSIDVVYQASGRSSETRRLTPILIEQRGPRYYLIAYCHTRRGNRTFRLDRLTLV